PRNRGLLRRALPQPESADQLLGLRERAIGHEALFSVELDAGALLARIKPFDRYENPGFRQFVVKILHRRPQLIAWFLSALTAFNNHHESHYKSSSFLSASVHGTENSRTESGEFDSRKKKTSEPAGLLPNTRDPFER